jgi:2-methylcitrate dehydratase PrpD
MTAPTQDLIDFLHATTLPNLSDATVRSAQFALLDTLGCALFGSPEPWSTIMADEMLAEGGHGRSTIVGRSETVPAPAAALCNGTAAHGFELDDHLDEAIVHPGAIVVSAALATAEACDASGERLLLGLVAGYEVLNRIGLAMGVRPAQRGYHKTAVAGPLGAAVAAGIVMRLPADQLFTALCLACATASGTKAFASGAGGGMEKRMHAGRAAEAGVRMAQLAARGFSAPPTAVEGKFGLLEVVSGETARPDLIADDLGTSWAIDNVYVKTYPCCAWIQAAVQQLVDMRGPDPLQLRDIAKVRVGVSAYAKAQNGAVAPVDTFGAQFSIPYCCALALMGDPADPASYDLEAIDDPDRRELARRIEIFVDPEMEAAYPRHYGARVELELASGRCHADSVLDPHGMPADPCTPEELLRKFRKLACRTRPPDAVEALCRIVQSMNRQPRLDALSTLLRP